MQRNTISINTKVAIVTGFRAIAGDPVTDRSYTPDGTIPATGLARWIDRSSGIYAGFPWITFQIRFPTPKSDRYIRVSLRGSVPTLNITSPSTGSGIQPLPSAGYENSFFIEFKIHEASSSAEKSALVRTAACFFADNLLDSAGAGAVATNSPLRLAVQTGEPVW
jgi:hypothetical protein